MTSVADPEISAFLSGGTRTGMLGFAGADGRPLVTPVWFIVEDGCLVFNTGKETAKGRALARDPVRSAGKSSEVTIAGRPFVSDATPAYRRQVRL